MLSRESGGIAISEINKFGKYNFHISKASLEAAFNGEMQLFLERRVRNVKLRSFALGKRYIFGRRVGNQKGKRWQGPGNIIARYGGTYALVHFRDHIWKYR